MGARDRLRLWLESFEDDPNPLTTPIQGVEKIPMFAKRYVAGEVGMQFDIWIRASLNDEHANQFLIRSWRRAHGDVPIRRAAIGHDPSVQYAVDITGEPWILEGGTLGSCDDQRHPAVLVYVGRPIEQEQSVGLGIGQLEGLEPLQEVDVVLSHVGQVPIRALDPFGWIGFDRKLNIPGLVISRLDPGQGSDRELPRQVIERPAQIVDGVTDQQGPVVSDLYDALDAPHDRPILVVVLVPERNVVRMWTNFGLKLVDMHFRPFELGPTTGEIEGV